MPWRIFCYHGVRAEYATAFARQLDGWVARGWNAVGFSEGIRRLDEGGRRFSVSFDDGQRSVCEVARRMLDDRGIPAMLYVATDYVARGSTYRDPSPVPACSWDQLGQWLEAGHQLGCHTHTHTPVSDRPEAWLADELELSRDILRRELAHRAEHFAYPHGRHDSRIHQLLKDRGDWTSASTVDRGWNGPGSDPLRLRRDPVEPEWSPLQGGLRLAMGRHAALGSMVRRARLGVRRCLPGAGRS
jgi:peptidoglycan/xylan/chitin deacetylase (PgdA/CDA1 family)